MSQLNNPTLERLVQYYHFIQARPSLEQVVLSSSMARYADVDPTLVRKDLAAIGVQGRTRVGYHKANVLRAIERTLGFGLVCRAVIVGAGRLGCALASYPGFAKYGLTIQALFDLDPAKVGSHVNDIRVQPLEYVDAEVRRHGVSLAILTMPAHAAQEATDHLVRAGIRAIWNFAPVNLSVPRGVFVRHEHLSVGLGVVVYHLRKRGTALQPAPKNPVGKARAVTRRPAQAEMARRAVASRGTRRCLT
jgi:redox-sensing transcriptional repressor